MTDQPMRELTPDEIVADIEAMTARKGKVTIYQAWPRMILERERKRSARSLPSPAPEPPLDPNDIDPAADSPDIEWEPRAAQPAPDPEALRLLRRLVDVLGPAQILWRDPVPEDSQFALNDARSFLRARESGGEP